MLDFGSCELCFKVRCYTNINWIYEKFKNSNIKFVDKLEESDMCIVDKNYKFVNEDINSSLKISIDGVDDKVDAFIDRNNIEAYLNIIDKYESEKYEVGIADFNDIKEVTRGSLIEYVKININNNSNNKDIEEFRKSFKQCEVNVDVIVFSSFKELDKLSNFLDALEDVYSIMNIVIMTLVDMENQKDNYVEVFVFKK